MPETPATARGPSGGPAAAPASPSWPTLSSPQQLTPPPASTAQEKSLPAASGKALPRFRSRAVVTPMTARGDTRSLPPPSPSCPLSSAPQQKIAPAAVAAQVCASPVATATTSLTPLTRTGSARGVRVPSPSWPRSLRPQHHRLPCSCSRQAWPPPALTNATLFDSHDAGTQASESLARAVDVAPVRGRAFVGGGDAAVAVGLAEAVLGADLALRVRRAAKVARADAGGREQGERGERGDAGADQNAPPTCRPPGPTEIAICFSVARRCRRTSTKRVTPTAVSAVPSASAPTPTRQRDSAVDQRLSYGL